MATDLDRLRVAAEGVGDERWRAAIEDAIAEIRELRRTDGSPLERQLVAENAELARQWDDALSECDRLKDEIIRISGMWSGNALMALADLAGRVSKPRSKGNPPKETADV